MCSLSWLSVAISPSLLPLTHSISQSLWRISRMLKESAMPTSRPQRHLCLLSRSMRVIKWPMGGVLLCRLSVVYHLAGDLNYSKSIITELCNSLLDMFLSKRIFVAAAKWYVLKAWYAYLSDRRQRLRSFLEGAAQSLKRRSKMQRGHSPRL